MNRILGVAMTGLTALLSAGTAPAGAPASPPVREIADASLRDVAVAVYDPAHPVIYYNPALMRRFGPELAAFFMAHEHAHITLRHTRSAALRTQRTRQSRVLQQKELEADCLAAHTLGVEGRAASLAAVRFFARLGPTSYDTEHPTGSQRAQKILACMPE